MARTRNAKKALAEKEESSPRTRAKARTEKVAMASRGKTVEGAPSTAEREATPSSETVYRRQSRSTSKGKSIPQPHPEPLSSTSVSKVKLVILIIIIFFSCCWNVIEPNLKGLFF